MAPLVWLVCALFRLCSWFNSLHLDRFKLHKKKLLRGHNNAGFACGITTPPDGAHQRSTLQRGPYFSQRFQVHT